MFRPSKHWLCFSFGFVIERQVRVYATVPTNPPNGCHKTQPRAKCVILCKHMYFWDSARSEKSCRTPSQVAILAVSCFFFAGKRADNRNRLNSSALAGTAGSKPQGWDKAATQRRPFQKHSCMFFLAYMSPFVSAFYSLLQLWKITTLSTCSPFPSSSHPLIAVFSNKAAVSKGVCSIREAHIWICDIRGIKRK